jgi:hypothetical protein
MRTRGAPCAGWKVLGRLGHAEAASADGRVVDDDAVAAHAFEHDEVVHLPVHDAGQAQRLKLFQLDPHRARRKAHALGHAHEVGQVDTLQ